MRTFQIVIYRDNDTENIIDVLSPSDASDTSRDYVLMCAYAMYPTDRHQWHIRPYDA